MDEAEIEKPIEWTSALVEVRPSAGKWTHLSFRRNGERISLRQEEVAGRVRTIASWPRSGPGHYHLQLEGPEVEYEETVSIWPEKISRAEYRELLEDLESRLPVQVAVALQKAGGLSGVELSRFEGTTVEQELVRVRRAVEGTERRPGLIAVLRELAKDPHRVLTTEERWVRRGRARRPPADRLGLAYARPGNALAGELKQVPDVRTRHTTDVYENRLVRQFLRQVQLRLRRLESILRDQGHEKAANTAVRLTEQLDAAERGATFLEGVSELNRPPARASMVLQNRAPYRAVLKGYLEFQKGIGVILDTPALEAPLDNLPYLYQLWCTLQVIRVCVEQAQARGFRCQRSSLFKQENGYLALRLSGPAVELYHPESNARVKLIPERTYATGSAKAVRSISYAQRPDLAIEVSAPSRPKAIYLFDPKYKLDSERSGPEDSSLQEDILQGSPKKPDIDKMHAYRDAIRDEEGRHVVRYAAILYPGRTETFAKGLEAIGARPGHQEEFCSRIAQVFDRAFETV